MVQMRGEGIGITGELLQTGSDIVIPESQAFLFGHLADGKYSS